MNAVGKRVKCLKDYKILTLRVFESIYPELPELNKEYTIRQEFYIHYARSGKIKICTQEQLGAIKVYYFEEIRNPVYQLDNMEPPFRCKHFSDPF
jgi:hypothetical protein